MNTIEINSIEALNKFFLNTMMYMKEDLVSDAFYQLLDQKKKINEWIVFIYSKEGYKTLQVKEIIGNSVLTYEGTMIPFEKCIPCVSDLPYSCKKRYKGDI